MKLNKLFTLALVLTVLFTLAAVAAGEDADNSTFSDDALTVNGHDSAEVRVDEIHENQDISGDDGSLSEGDADETDLSVRIDVENAYDGNEFNRAGFKVPWNITAKVEGATAHNVKLNVSLTDNLEYFSHVASVGEFNPATGIWDIGDLDSNGSPLLTLVTKIKSDGRFKVTVAATSDSQDADLSNNQASLIIRSGTSKSVGDPRSPHDPEDSPRVVKSTSKTDDRNKTSHRRHHASEGSNNYAKNHHGSNSVSKEISSDNLISNIIESLFGSQDTEINSNSNDTSNQNESPSNQHVNGVSEHDYSVVPLAIFVVFLILFAAIVGYGRKKS